MLLRRLLPGIWRQSPIPPGRDRVTDTTVSVIVPTLNEAERVGPCLAGVRSQGAPVLEVIVVDSNSTDGTQGLVAAAAGRDSRVRLVNDPPLPDGWIGKVWALQHGLSLARGEWILGLDADVEPNEGMVAGAVAAARDQDLELVSFSPLFAGQTPAERWLQPALLASLIYRTGAPGTRAPPHLLLANGQCFLVRRDTLLRHGGYEAARDSFADDVRLARFLAARGVRCGFLDGRLLFRVRSYRSAAEMWREWGRSVDLADATGRGRQLLHLLLLLFALAIPVPMLVLALLVSLPLPLIAVNLVLLSVRIAVLFSIAPSYERRGVPFYASWLADPAAFVRVAMSTFRRPVSWRGRSYRHAENRGRTSISGASKNQGQNPGSA